MEGMTMSEAREEMLREIILHGLSGAVWIPVEGGFHNGDEMGFDHNGVKVRAVVNFDERMVAVTMTSPLRCGGANMLRRPSFFNRKPQGSLVCEDGSATQLCLDSAKDILVGLYSDWVILSSRRDVIQRKFAEFPGFSAKFLENEKERIAPIRESWHNLSSVSHGLKLKFKSGEMSQVDYIMQKRPISAAIAELQEGMKMGDPFQVMFADELKLLRNVLDPKAFLGQLV